jgi:hypothetical protein
MGPKKGTQRKKIIGDALWIGLVGWKKKFNIYCVTPWCLVLKFKFIGAAVWFGRACGKKTFNIFCDAVVFGTEILAGKPRGEMCLALLFVVE